jgi:hypothetical protein
VVEVVVVIVLRLMVDEEVVMDAVGVPVVVEDRGAVVDDSKLSVDAAVDDAGLDVVDDSVAVEEGESTVDESEAVDDSVVVSVGISVDDSLVVTDVVPGATVVDIWGSVVDVDSADEVDVLVEIEVVDVEVGVVWPHPPTDGTASGPLPIGRSSEPQSSDWPKWIMRLSQS